MGHHGGPEWRGYQAGLSYAGVFSQEEAGLPQGQVSVTANVLNNACVLYWLYRVLETTQLFVLTDCYK